MKFELEFEKINFILEITEDKSYTPDDRFERLSPQTMIALRKKEIAAYSLIIIASKEMTQMTFYKSGILLSSKADEVLEELQEYLEAENLIEDVCDSFKRAELPDGPIWKLE